MLTMLEQVACPHLQSLARPRVPNASVPECKHKVGWPLPPESSSGGLQQESSQMMQCRAPVAIDAVDAALVGSVHR